MSLYEKDFMGWCWQQAEALQKSEYEKLDLQHLREEIEDLGNSQHHALANHLKNLMLHMIKMEVQFETGDTKSWEISIGNARDEVNYLLEDVPSLNHYFERLAEKAWPRARRKAFRETGIDLKDIREEMFTKEEMMGQ